MTKLTINGIQAYGLRLIPGVDTERDSVVKVEVVGGVVVSVYSV